MRKGLGRHRTKQEKHTSTLLLVLAITAAPVLATLTIQLLTIKPDLRSAELASKQRPADAVLLRWLGLEATGPGPDAIGRTAQQACGKRARIPGYMMDIIRPIRDGEVVRELPIAPECGTLLHPAHFDLDQTIEVYLRKDCTAVFERREAVWATGIFSIQESTTAPDRPLYRLDNACLERIQDEELRRLTTP